MIRRVGRRAADDAGASLILALAFVTFLGLVVGALLTYSSTNLLASGKYKERADTLYDVDGALQTAVNQVRNSTYNNDVGETCPPLTFPGSNLSRSVDVTCRSGPGTGAAGGSVPITSGNKPPAALLTVGTDPREPGIGQNSNSVFRIHGPVYTSGSVAIGGHPCDPSGPQPPTGVNCSEIYDDGGQVVARGSCQGTVYSVPAKSCNDPRPPVPDPAAAAPASYSQPTTGLVYQRLPSCGPGGTVKFSPGYYDDAVGLSNMMSGNGACSGKTFLFQPGPGGVGVYYFDFHNGEGGGLPNGTHTWKISDARSFVVGGAPQGWDPDASPRQVPTVPGSCASPLRSTSNRGVEFVFGGDSRIAVTAGKVELCGQYYGSKPPIVVYGAKTGADPDPTGPLTGRTDGTGTNPGTGPGFANPGNIRDQDGAPATAQISGVTGGATASVLVSGFAPSLPIEPGSLLTSAELVVVHRDNNALPTDRLQSITATVAPTRPGAMALTPRGVPTYQDGATGTGYHTDRLDLTTDLTREVHDYGLPGLQVRYDATVAPGNTVTENLDTIQLVIAWTPPAVRGERTGIDGHGNCVGSAPYVPGGPSCALVTTEGNQAAWYMQGTVYAPYAALDIKLTNVSGQVFRSGAIVRSLRITVTASSSMQSPVIDLPDTSPGNVPLEVYFQARGSPCRDGGSCDSEILGTAVAQYTDPTGVVLPGHRQVRVVSWAVRRS